MASVIQAKATPVYTWNSSNRTYSAGKNILSQAEVRGYVDAAIKQARNEARAIAEAFLEHGNSAAFETEMKALLKNLHLSSAMVANGGREQMTQSLWAKTGNILKSQYSYLESFGRSIDAGEVTLGEGLIARAEMYAMAGINTFESFVRDGMADAGMTEAMNILGGGNNCSECPSLSDQEWIPIDDMPMPGERECHVNCQCSIEYR